MTNGAEEKVFKDPVHDSIYVKDPLIWNLINTPAFQRLRRVKQLGTSFMVFHGSEHSRFSHSLGTYEVMRQVLSHFSRNHGWPEEDRTRKLALVAALLHDIGHGPFSHTFETVFKTEHEIWTQKIILQEPHIRSILDGVDADFAEDVVSVIAKKPKFPLLVSLISSQLDVDRMDYLLRDALHTGVSYGRYEVERLIRIMRPEGDRIVIKPSGLHTVEQYLLARYFMYSQVYLHPDTMGVDVLLRKTLMRARDLFSMNELGFISKEIAPFFEKDTEKITIQEYLGLDENGFMHALIRWGEEEDPILKDLASRFLNRRLLGSIALKQEMTVDGLIELQTSFDARGIPSEYYLSYKPISISGYLYKEGIKYLSSQGGLVDVYDESALIRSLQPETKYRLYYPKDWMLEQRFQELQSLLQSL